MQYDSQCGSGYVCGYPNGTSICVPAVPTGGSCKNDLQACESGDCCDFNTNTCKGPLPNGATCTGLCAGRCDKTTDKCVDICGGTRD